MRTLARCFLILALLAPVVSSCGTKETPPTRPGPASETPAAAPVPTPAGTTTADVQQTATAVPAASPAREDRPVAEVQSPPESAAPSTATPVPPTWIPTTQPEVATPAPAPTQEPTPAAPPRETATAPPPAGLPTRPEPKGKVTLPAKSGAVTFDHAQHAGELKVACATCHHANREQKPLSAQNQARRECHTQPATAPVTTSLRAAFHDAKATAGLRVDCHREAAKQGRTLPLKCADCHRKGAG